MALKTLRVEENARILVELPHEKARLLVHVRDEILGRHLRHVPTSKRADPFMLHRRGG